MSLRTPLRLEPILKPRLWGGTRLRDEWGKVLPTDEPYGESWELTWRPEGLSRVLDGPHEGRTLAELAAVDRDALLGPRLAGLGSFPLLVKLLDCSQRLSVQVHPTETYAAAHAEAEVKTEAWYVLDAPPGATLVFGLRDGVTREAFSAAVRDGHLADTLAERPVRPGDVLLVKPGTVHALLEGLLVYEIQQSSDTTYRVYDWDRVDAAGKPRDLHVRQALDCIAFGSSPPATSPAPLTLGDARELLVATPMFALERVRVEGTWRGETGGGRFEVLTVADGGGSASGVKAPLRRGETLVVPAAADYYELTGSMTVLRGYVPAWPEEVWAPCRAAGHADDAILRVCGGFGPDAS